MTEPRETLKQAEAFEQYYAMGVDRSYRALAPKINVCTTTVRNWGRKFNWQERVKLRDIENSRKLQKKTDQTILDVKANYRKIIQASMAKYLEALKNDDLDIKSIGDLEKLIKLDLLLMGEATDRGEYNVSDTRNELYQKLLTLGNQAAN